MSYKTITRKEVLADLLGQDFIDDGEEDVVEENGIPMTYQMVLNAPSFPNARAAADWMEEQERIQAEEKRARAQKRARMDAEAKAAAESQSGAKKEETALEKKKRAARKWLATLEEPEKQARGSAHAHVRAKTPPITSTTTADTAGAKAKEPSRAAPQSSSQPQPTSTSTPPPKEEAEAPLPDGWTHGPLGYRSPTSFNPDGGFSYSFSSFRPSATANEDYTIPEGEDPDPEACPMCAVFGRSNGRGRCLHTGWRKDENGVWSGPSAESDEDESFIKVRAP